jgi:hypothetical protein
MAHRAVSGVRPHTIITDDLTELREELEQAVPGELGAELSRGAQAADCFDLAEAVRRRPRSSAGPPLCRVI